MTNSSTPTDRRESLRERFEEALPTFYGGEKGQVITWVKLTEKGLIKSAETILAFLAEEVERGKKEEKERMKGVLDKWDSTNGPQIEAESGRPFYYKDWIIRLLSSEG